MTASTKKRPLCFYLARIKKFLHIYIYNVKTLNKNDCQHQETSLVLLPGENKKVFTYIYIM